MKNTEEFNATLQIFAKVPVKGFVKTRLAAQTNADFALAVAKASLRHLCDKASNIWQGNIELWLANYDSQSPSEFIQLLQQDFPNICLKSQSTGNLGDKMLNGMKMAAKDNQQAVIIGADIPHITEHHLRQAYQLAMQKQSLIGPCFDGGYYMISSHCLNDDMFLNVDWGSPLSFQQTIASWQKATKVKPVQLDHFFDIDHHEDVVNAIDIDPALGLAIKAQYNATIPNISSLT